MIHSKLLQFTLSTGRGNTYLIHIKMKLICYMIISKKVALTTCLLLQSRSESVDTPNSIISKLVAKRA
jgi:hypothetical protein